jgi:hypothetical protein
MYDVHSTAVWCTESTECLTVIVCRYFCSPLVTVPVAILITGVTIIIIIMMMMMMMDSSEVEFKIVSSLML